MSKRYNRGFACTHLQFENVQKSMILHCFDLKSFLREVMNLIGDLLRYDNLVE